MSSPAKTISPLSKTASSLRNLEASSPSDRSSRNTPCDPGLSEFAVDHPVSHYPVPHSQPERRLQLEVHTSCCRRSTFISARPTAPWMSMVGTKLVASETTKVTAKGSSPRSTVRSEGRPSDPVQLCSDCVVLPWRGSGFWLLRGRRNCRQCRGRYGFCRWGRSVAAEGPVVGTVAAAVAVGATSSVLQAAAATTSSCTSSTVSSRAGPPLPARLSAPV